MNGPCHTGLENWRNEAPRELRGQELSKGTHKAKASLGLLLSENLTTRGRETHCQLVAKASSAVGPTGHCRMGGRVAVQCPKKVGQTCL